jgi:gliding motility-associated lipoprotein GldJ
MNFLNSILLFFAVLLVGPTFLANSENKQSAAIELAAKKYDPYEDMVDVKGGTFTFGMNNEDVMGDWNNLQTRKTVSSFKIDKYEVSNKKYRDYTHWLEQLAKDSSVKDSKAKDLYKQMAIKSLPDTTVWKEALGYNDPMVEGYFRAKAYNNYPVVGVTWNQANDYCKWRTDRANEIIYINLGYLKKGDKYVGKIDTANKTAVDKQVVKKKIKTDDEYIFGPVFRLPTEAEWEYAAKVSTMKNAATNFRQPKSGANAVHNKSSLAATDSPFPWGGNGVDNLRSTKKGKQGMYMANFKAGTGDYMGMVGYKNDGAGYPSSVNSFMQNSLGLYNMSGNVNEWVADVYRPLSSVDMDDLNPYRRDSTLDGDDNKTSLYDAENTLISNKSRVIKGGSWKDRPYWLNVGTRRPMDLDKASSTTGFRCATALFGKDAVSESSDNATPWWKRLFKK